MLKGEKKVGLVYQYRKLSINEGSLAMSTSPALKMTSHSMTMNIIVQFLTKDSIEQLRKDYPDLVFKMDMSIKKKFAIWYRKKRGLYTGTEEEKSKSDTKEQVQLLAFNMDLKKKKGVGMLCVDCMKKQHPNDFRNAEKQLNGYATFV